MRTQEEELAWLRGYTSIHDDASVNPYNPNCVETGHLYYKYERAKEKALNDLELNKDFNLRQFRNSF